MNLIERLRGEVVSHELRKMTGTWAQRRMRLVSTFSDPQLPSRSELLDLGDHLSKTFRLDLVNDRSQGSLAGGGSVWQALICHYLNICFAGTDAIALSRKFVPDCIKSALKVSYTSSASVQADLDVMVLHVPGVSKLPDSLRGNSRIFSKHVCANFSETTVVVIQAKTNWNDNAQIPMLWNFLYRLAAGGKIPSNGFSVGSGSWHLKQLKSFAYTFVTVPTNKIDSFKPTGMPILRVSNMSGGAYWGMPSKNGVMLSIKEFFSKNYNVANHNFPEPAAMGVAFSRELRERGGEIDIHAFDLVASEALEL
jgi:hypothetical protein